MALPPLLRSFSRASTLVSEGEPQPSRPPTPLSQASTLVEQPAEKVRPGKMHAMQAQLLKKFRDGKAALKDKLATTPSKAKTSLSKSADSTHAQYQITADMLKRKTTGTARVMTSQWDLEIHPPKTGVRKITLEGGGYEDKDLALLRKKFPDLRHVRITGSNWLITDKGVEHLKGMKLESLALIGSNITDASLEHIKAMPLTRLQLDGCHQISGAIFQALENSKVQHLGLSATHIDAITPDILQSLVRMEALTHLDIRASYRDCSESAFNVLRAMLDDGLLCDGLGGTPRAGSQEDFVAPLMKQLLDGGLIRHAPSVTWAQKLLQIEPKASTMMKLANKTGIIEAAQTTAQEFANGMAEAAMQSEAWKRKGELAGLAPQVGQQFAKELLEKNPNLTYAVSLMSGSAAAPVLDEEELNAKIRKTPGAWVDD